MLLMIYNLHRRNYFDKKACVLYRDRISEVERNEVENIGRITQVERTEIEFSRTRRVEICYPISRIETVFAIRHDSVDLFPEFSLVDPSTYPCFPPEGFDSYRRTRQKSFDKWNSTLG